ncbi:T9SS type A sorting domain-containing protein [Larkinella arboricola]
MEPPKSYTAPGVYAFTVPFWGGSQPLLLTVNIRGGDGGGDGTVQNNKGGSGASVQATFRVSSEDVLFITVGQAGRSGGAYGGGGGGSAVTLDKSRGNRSLLVVAGGGGGGSPAWAGGGGQGLGPASGGPGGVAVYDSYAEGGGGGGGLNGPGEIGHFGYPQNFPDSQPWRAGGGGSQAVLGLISPGGFSFENLADGGAGFGGGGGTGSNPNSGGGGGGGYGGGKGGGYYMPDREEGISGGGYSYISPAASMTAITPGSTRGTQYQDGAVTLTLYTSAPIAVDYFNLINAETNKTILGSISEGSVINLAELPSRKLNLSAITYDNDNENPIGSVVFELSGPQSRTHIENTAPYALFEDTNGSYKNWTPQVGSYTLTATPYSGPNGTGTAGTKVNFTVVDELSMKSFTLIDAQTNQPIVDLTDGQVLDLASLPSHVVNIRANTRPETVGSVILQLGGQQTLTQVENEPPYALFKDDGTGNYRTWKPKLGTYTLAATPYAGPNGTGKAGIPFSINFKVINSSPAARLAADAESGSGSIQIFPNPFTESFTIQSKLVQSGPQAVALYDMLGRWVWQGVTTSHKPVVRVSNQLGAGTYVLRVGEGQNAQHIRVVKTP